MKSLLQLDVAGIRVAYARTGIFAALAPLSDRSRTRVAGSGPRRRRELHPRVSRMLHFGGDLLLALWATAALAVFLTVLAGLVLR